MTRQFVRSISDVKDPNKLAEQVTTINDLISDVDGKVYVVTKNGYEQITGGASEGDLTEIKTNIDSIKSDITNIKSEQTKVKNRVTALETAKAEQDTKNEDFETRIKALETPAE